MQIRKQVHLQFAKESLQIPYPKGFSGLKTPAGEDDNPAEFHLTCQPRWLTPDEIAVAEAFIKRLTYHQVLVLTGAVLIDPEDPLLNADHSTIDAVEKEYGLPNSRYAAPGAERQLRERVLILRERGCLASGNKALTGA
jgi:hypothetical protein